MDKLEVLRKSELSRTLDDEQLGILAGMCTTQVFEPGEIICKQDRKENKTYVIEDGLVAIILEVGPLSQRQVQAASNFEVLGWSALIEPYTCTATAKATEKTKVLAFDAKELGRLFHSNPNIMYKVGSAVAYVVARRLRSAYTQLLGVTSQD